MYSYYVILIIGGLISRCFLECISPDYSCDHFVNGYAYHRYQRYSTTKLVSRSLSRLSFSPEQQQQWQHHPVTRVRRPQLEQQQRCHQLLPRRRQQQQIHYKYRDKRYQSVVPLCSSTNDNTTSEYINTSKKDKRSSNENEKTLIQLKKGNLSRKKQSTVKQLKHKDFGKPRSKQTTNTYHHMNHDKNLDNHIMNLNDDIILDINQYNEIQYNRRYNDDINCEHYYNTDDDDKTKKLLTCSGCSIMKGIGNPNYIPVIKSAQLFFSSPTIQRCCVTTGSNNNKIPRKDNNSKEYNNKANNTPIRYDRSNAVASSSSFYQVIVPTDITGWRTQAKLVATSKSTSSNHNKGGCLFGLYHRDTHIVVPVSNCQVHHPLINQAIKYLEIATTKAGIVPYHTNHNGMDNNSKSTMKHKRPINKSRQIDERTSGQLLRYVQIQVERITQTVCLTLVFYASDMKETQPALARLIKELNKVVESQSSISEEEGMEEGGEAKLPRKLKLWHSIWCHCNDSIGNNVFYRMPSSQSSPGNNAQSNVNKRWYRMMGPEYVREPIIWTNGAQVNNGWLHYTPMSFRQGNLNGFDEIVKVVARAIPAGSKVCELYAGVGIIGLSSLVYHYQHYLDNKNDHPPLQWLRCSDENPSNPKCFHRSVETLPSEITGRSQSKYKNVRKGVDHHDDTTMTLAELASDFLKSSSNNNNNNDRKGMMKNNDNNIEKTSYMVASAGMALKAGQALGANVLIVDPPRKGLDDDVIIELCKPYNTNQPLVDDVDTLLLYVPDGNKIHYCNDVRTLIYVSCGFDAFARDCEKLVSSPAGWKITSATGYILFPGGDHIETVAIFER